MCCTSGQNCIAFYAFLKESKEWPNGNTPFQFIAEIMLKTG